MRAVVLAAITFFFVGINANAAPLAYFYVRNTTVEIGDQIAFISQSKDDSHKIVNQEWRVEKSKQPVGTGSYFQYAFQTPGKYDVSLDVTNDAGETTTFSQTIKVLDHNQPPEVRFLNKPKRVLVGQPTAFKLRAKDSDGKIAKITWQVTGFKEIATNSDKFEFTFPKERTYLVVANVTDDRGATTSVSQKLFALDPSAKTPASIRASRSKARVNQPVVFMAKMMKHAKDVSRIDWDFGDGTLQSSTDLQVSHSFSRPGQYSIAARLAFEDGSILRGGTSFTAVAGSGQSLTGPSQVVINENSYVEVAPTQQMTLDFSVYNGTDEMTSYGAPSWSVGGSSVSVLSSQGNTATIKGVSPGISTITVAVDGKASQVVTVNVLGFTSGAVVTQKGRFVGARRSEFCMFLDRPTGDPNPKWYIIPNLSDYPTFTNAGEGSSKVAACKIVNLPASEGQVAFTAENATYTDSLNYTKQNVKAFYGRKGFLVFDDAATGTSMNVDFNDNRYINLDADFSVTFWSYINPYGNSVSLSFKGNQTFKFDSNANLTFQYPGSVATLFSPKTPDFFGRWHHVSLTYSVATRVFSYYIDGDFLASTVIPTTGLGGTPEIQLNALGTDAYLLDELRFWNKTLNAQEVASELFTPAPVDSGTLLAVFSFDNGFAQSMPADNGAAWALSLIPINKSEPRVASESALLLNQNLSSSQTYAFQINSPYQEFGRGVFEMNVYLPLGNDINLFAEASSCVADCSSPRVPSALKSKRFSPYLHLKKIAGVVNSVLISIPFDSAAVDATELSQIKVMHWQSLSEASRFEVLEPQEINMTQGYVKVGVNSGGDFWVGVPVSHASRAIKYTNGDLLPSFWAEAGTRDFTVQLPMTATQYSLTSDSSSYQISSASCPTLGGFTTGNYTFPLSIPPQDSSIQSLQPGFTICDLTYVYLPGTTEEYYSMDRFVIFKGN